MKYGYKLDLLIGSDVELGEDTLIELGVEMHQCILSFMKSKRIPAKLIGEFDIRGVPIE